MKMILSVICVICVLYALFNWSAENPKDARQINTTIKQGATEVVDKAGRAVDELTK